jgi:predicted enzyme related to lactoylglutathione lyase
LGVKSEGDDTHSVFNEFNLAIWNPGTINKNKFKTSERYFTLMFEVKNADKEYDRLKHLDLQIVFTSQPTTLPWGARAFGFKDTDGNNIDFLSPVKK